MKKPIKKLGRPVSYYLPIFKALGDARNFTIASEAGLNRAAELYVAAHVQHKGITKANQNHLKKQIKNHVKSKSTVARLAAVHVFGNYSGRNLKALYAQEVTIRYMARAVLLN